MSLSAVSIFRLGLIALVSIQHLCLATPTEVMRRPNDYLREVHHGPTADHSKRELQERSNGLVQIGYYANWDIYARNFQPTDILPTTLSHILYAFADVDPSSGNIVLSDSYADEQKHYPNDSWTETGNNLYGNLKQLYLLKLANRNLKVLLSVGGWTYSQDGHFSFVTNPTSRATFVSDAVSMIEDLGLDGIDIDFEFPASTAEGEGFASLITSLRTAFNQLASRKGDSVPYQITAAVSAGANNSAFLDVPTMDAALSYWNVMAYDFAGSWSTVSDNQANLYGGQGFSNVSGDDAVKSYITRGATASKIALGMPIYGRGFEETLGLHMPFNGIGTGTWEAGVWDYKDLPMAGATVFENATTASSNSYDPVKEELISYDTPDIVATKAKYIMSNGLAGSMFWELSSDKLGSGSLVETVLGVFGSMDHTQNHIDYPDSSFTNIANNMGSSSSGGGGTSAPGTPTSTSGGSTPTSGSCAGVAAWVSTAVYTGGKEATYSGDLWTAKWWTQGDTPGGAAGVWTNDGSC